MCYVLRKMLARSEGLESRADFRLGQMAVRQGRLSAEQLRLALEEQADGLRRGRKKPRRLGAIVAEKGWLTDAEVLALLEEQEAWILAQESRRREDSLMGRILVDGGFAEAAHVQECLRLQAGAVEAGAEAPPRLGELLVQKGYARPEDIEQALELQAGVRFRCAACGREWKVEELAVDDLGVCPGCRGALESLPGAEEPPSAPPLPAPGLPLETLGRYRIQARLGRGAMGDVYEALDVPLDRKVALKLLRSEFRGPAGEKEIARFGREAQMAARLPKHAGVAEIFEIGHHDGHHYIAMELLRGQTLGDWRKASGRSLRELVRVLRDVAIAVQHAHDHGVLHRDLKPGNIIVDAQGRASVVDFGLARPSDPDDPAGRSGIICGTASYMSPEQAEGARDIDVRCDVYSLGVMLYEVLAGRTPFQGASRDELIEKLRTQAVAPPGGFARSRPFSTVDAAIEKICMRALTRDRAGRTATARAFAAELTLWLEQRERKAPAAAMAPRTVRRRWRVPAAAGAGLLLILLGALALAGGGGEEAELRRARSRAAAGQAEEALAVYEGILKRSPGHAKAREGRDLMLRHLLSEAAKDVEEAVAAVERERAQATQVEAALRNASLADEARLREQRAAVARRLGEAEAQLGKAREALRRWSGGSR